MKLRMKSPDALMWFFLLHEGEGIRRIENTVNTVLRITGQQEIALLRAVI